MTGPYPLGAAATARPTRGVTRWVRVGVLGAMSLLLAAVAHLAAGGQLPSAGILTMTGVLLGLVAATMTARRCRFGVLATVLTLQQVLLHLLFDAAQATTGCGVPDMSGMNHAGHVAGQLCDPSAVAAMGHPPGWTMWAAHLAATVLTAALLARGEDWLWRVADEIVQAANAAPAGWPEPVRSPALGGAPESPFTPGGRSRAEPRAPPQVLVVR